MNVDVIMNYVATNGVDLLLKLGAALAIWIIGRWTIATVMTLVSKGIARGGKIDATVSRYITSILSAMLTIGLVMGILGYLGVETTSFAALLAGAGLAIGTAWGGPVDAFRGRYLHADSAAVQSGRLRIRRRLRRHSDRTRVVRHDDDQP